MVLVLIKLEEGATSKVHPHDDFTTTDGPEIFRQWRMSMAAEEKVVHIIISVGCYC